ncbi:MAG: ScyD/ScyE family protein [Acidobacteria bacterium]|nr:MAG: ScyD/ScyE family protein [Acidobacteriota bacterium]
MSMHAHLGSRRPSQRHSSSKILMAALALSCLLAPAMAQEIVTGGLLGPVKIDSTPGGNLLIVETGSGQHDSTVQLATTFGQRFLLVGGLPSVLMVEGLNGPAGVADAHRTLYVLIGEGDVRGDAPPGVAVPNPDGLSSAIFSSILAFEFYPVPDEIRTGFVLTEDDHRRLADGEIVEKTNDDGESVRAWLVADFRDLEPDAQFGIRQANPFDIDIAGGLTEQDLVELGLEDLGLSAAEFYARFDPASPVGQRLRERTSLIVADAGMNTISRVPATGGRIRMIWRMPPVPNPLFPTLGGPVAEAVPTSVHVVGDTALVGQLTGFPFVGGVAKVWTLDLVTGARAPYIEGLRSVTDVFTHGGATYVVQVSNDLLAGAPGSLLRFDDPSQPPQVVGPVLIGPTGITYSHADGGLFVTENFTGTVRRFQVD